MKILITAFEPFGSEKENSSEKVINTLRDFQDVEKLILPVVFDKCYEKVFEKMRGTYYDYILMTGESCGRTAISVERIAINIKDSRMPDSSGKAFENEKIFEDGADGYFSGLNTEEIKKAFKAEKIPLLISNSAGTYVCNNLFYGVLHKIRKEGLKTRAGFFHIPCLTEQVANRPNIPSVSLETAIKGMETVLILAMEGAL
jgi:pyroglutamyl-peptidase